MSYLGGDQSPTSRRLARPGLGRLVVGLMLCSLAGVPLLAIIGRMVYAAVGPASADPHGYLMIFGVVASLVLAVPLIIGIVLVIAGLRVRRGTGRG